MDDMSEQTIPSTIPIWTLGDRLAKSLHKAGIGMGEMADYLGVSRNTVGNYCNDRHMIPRPTLMLWAMRTGVPIEWIQTGELPELNGPDDGGNRATPGYGANVLKLPTAA